MVKTVRSKWDNLTRNRAIFATDIGKSHHGHECPCTDMMMTPADAYHAVVNVTNQRLNLYKHTADLYY